MRDPEVEANRFCVTDMQVAVRLRRKASHDLVVLPGANVFRDNVANKIRGRCSFVCHCNEENYRRTPRWTTFARASFFWGAQAASLFFSAACRKALRVISIARTKDVVGKLPMTAGWQPALSRALRSTRIRPRPLCHKYKTPRCSSDGAKAHYGALHAG